MGTGSGLRLHLGCGSHVVDGWVNIDRSPGAQLAKIPGLRRVLRGARVLSKEQADAVFPRGIVRADVTRRIPVPDRSAEVAYSSHVIEHLSRWQALDMLRECSRVLRPGGLVRIVTPDLAEVIAAYEQTDTTRPRADVFMENLMTYRDPEGASALQRLGGKLFGGSAHQWLYDEESLRALLAEAGFVEIVRRGYRSGDAPDLNEIETRTGLVMEARRP
jgi:predicted SAM-dependent methyltransferase